MTTLQERLLAYANDPMWIDHAEVPKSLLREAAALLAAQAPGKVPDGFVLVPRGAAMLAAEVACDWLDLFPQLPGLEKYERYTYGPAVEQLREELTAMLAAAPSPTAAGEG